MVPYRGARARWLRANFYKASGIDDRTWWLAIRFQSWSTGLFQRTTRWKLMRVGWNVYAMAPRKPSQILVVGIKIASLLYIYKCLHSMSAIADDDLLQRYWPAVSTCVAHFKQRLCEYASTDDRRAPTAPTTFRQFAVGIFLPTPIRPSRKNISLTIGLTPSLPGRHEINWAT